MGDNGVPTNGRPIHIQVQVQDMYVGYLVGRLCHMQGITSVIFMTLS